ncbi:MAG: tRNA (adenosine(37)-N6)-dimethylallyltransferase MiaA [Treponemataceae bacterium]
MTFPVLVLFGPTASGKTAVLDRLFGGPGAAFPAEVVSADSMQVYRGMDIGTAKPESDLLARLPHHLINIRNPDETFNVGDFVRLADESCVDIASRGRLPVVCGGTGFYLKHFVLGLPEAPPSDPEIRDRLKIELETRGASALMAELAEVDPISATRIHLNDVYRITRALEVFRSSGRPLSSYRMDGAAKKDAATRPNYRFLCLSLERSRDELYKRIDERAHTMFTQGLATEVAALRASGYGSECPGMRAIGYKEFFLCDEHLIADRLPEIETLVARNSRHYAKRQIVFALSIPHLRTVRADAGVEYLVEEITRSLNAFLATKPA